MHVLVSVRKLNHGSYSGQAKMFDICD